MKLAITTWNENVSPVFDVSQKLLIIEITNGVVTNRETIMVPSLNSFEKAKLMIDSEITVLICGALTRSVEKMMLNHGLEVHTFITGEIESVIMAWQNNDLNQNFKMPGCRRRRYSETQPRCCQNEFTAIQKIK